jgi:hypothetical protein
MAGFRRIGNGTLIAAFPNAKTGVVPDNFSRPSKQEVK